jgi:hypothetical protein
MCTEFLPYKHIICVAGNNELSLDMRFIRGEGSKWNWHHVRTTCADHGARETGLRQAINASLAAQKLNTPRTLLTRCTHTRTGRPTSLRVCTFSLCFQLNQSPFGDQCVARVRI